MKDSAIAAPAWQLTVLRGLQFANYAAQVLVVTYFPLYFYSLGFTKLQIGAIYSVGPVLSIVSNLLVGVISDKTKNLRRILSLLFLGQILALALLLPLREFAIMSLVMALFYLFQTPVNSMLDSLTLLATERMKRSFPSVRMFGSLGYAVCAVLFGLALKAWGSDYTIVLSLISLAAALAFSIPVSDYQASIRKFEFHGLWQVFFRKETAFFFLFIMAVSVAHRINEGFLSVAMRDHGATDTVIGAASLASSVSEIPMFFLLSRFGHRFKEFPLLAAASAMYVVRMLLLGAAESPWAFVAIQAMHIVTFAIFYITALRCLQWMIPEEYRSSGQAVFTVVWTGLAGVVAGTLGGWMYDAYGLAALYRAGAVFAAIGCAGFAWHHLRRSVS